MYEQIEKPKESKSRAVANSVAQKKSNGNKGFQFEDNRPSNKSQVKFRNGINQEGQIVQKKNTLASKIVGNTTQLNTSGAQADVQAKMVEITNLVRDRLGHDEEQSTTEQYADDVINNGLCGGWVKLFMSYPDWVEPIYNVVRLWVRPDNLTKTEALAHFENHLEKRTKFEGAEHVVAVLSKVYSIMSELEPTAGYDSEPEWTAMNVGDIPASTIADDAVEPVVSRIKLKGKNAAKLICSHVEKLVVNDATGECMVHIESDIHHMALRVEKRLRKGKTKKIGFVITVVESENRGIVKVDSLVKAEHVLNLWLETDEPELTEVIVRTRTTGF